MRSRAAEEDGFTIVEALVASVVLVVGLLTAFSVLAIADHASATVRAREGGVALARQIDEDVRSLDYSQISSSSVVSSLQAMPALANSSSGSTWTVLRGPTGNQTTYTITVTVNSFNDAYDTSGSTSDVKQVAVTVSWKTFQGKTSQYTETTTLTAAGQDPGLIVSNLALYSPSSGYSGTEQRAGDHILEHHISAVLGHRSHRYDRDRMDAERRQAVLLGGVESQRRHDLDLGRLVAVGRLRRHLHDWCSGRGLQRRRRTGGDDPGASDQKRPLGTERHKLRL